MKHRAKSKGRLTTVARSAGTRGRFRPAVVASRLPDNPRKDLRRRITLHQAAILLWCLYQCALDDDLGYLDAETSMHAFLTKTLSQEIELYKLDLERLLHAGNVMDILGKFWSPDGKSFEEFISPILFKNEAYDRHWNLIISDKHTASTLKKKGRIIKKLVR